MFDFGISIGIGIEILTFPGISIGIGIDQTQDKSQYRNWYQKSWYRRLLVRGNPNMYLGLGTKSKIPDENTSFAEITVGVLFQIQHMISEAPQKENWLGLSISVLEEEKGNGARSVRNQSKSSQH